MSSDYAKQAPAARRRQVAAWLIRILGAAAATWLTGAGVAVYHAVFPARQPLAYTDVRYFRVTNQLSGGRPLLRVVSHASGSCGADFSIADQGAVPEAHRCFSGHGVYDPCFDGASFEEFECVTAPWDTTSIRFHVLKESWVSRDHQVRPRPITPSVPPWAVELVNGDRCTFLTGATAVIAGTLRLNYQCTHGAVYGIPDRRKPVWLVNYVRGGELSSTPAEVRVAWY